MKISAEINPSNSSHLRQGATKISHSHKYGKVIVFTDDFLVINLLINRKVTENYLLLLGSVCYNYPMSGTIHIDNIPAMQPNAEA